MEERENSTCRSCRRDEGTCSYNGVIIRYLVNVEGKIKAGAPLLILEAMKMQNAVPTPIDGVVKAINFRPGDSVNKDDILVVIG